MKNVNAVMEAITNIQLSIMTDNINWIPFLAMNSLDVVLAPISRVHHF
jgi:hypothetical protein